MTDEFYGLPPQEPDDSPPASTIAIIGGLVVAALGFVIAGIGIAVGWWGPRAHDDELAEAEPAAVVEAETGEPEPEFELPGAEVMPEAEDRPRPVAFEEADPFADAEPVPEIAPAGARGSGGASSGGDASSSGGASDAAPARYTGPRVSVTFARGHYDHVELKLGGRVLALAKDRTVKLRPGGYQIQLRESPDADWKSAGLIELEVGSTYKVTLFDPPLAKLEVVQ